MANFDAIIDENIETEDVSRVSEDYVPVKKDPVVVRGVGHMTM